MGTESAWVDTALGSAEATGKLDGMEIEHYVGGGLPPPYLRSDQLRLMTREGRDVVEFAVPNFRIPTEEGHAYPRDVYTVPATPEDVRLFARLVREAFAALPPAPERAGRHDTVRTELVVRAQGKEATRTYAGADPRELAALTATAEKLIERVKAQGTHDLKGVSP